MKDRRNGSAGWVGLWGGAVIFILAGILPAVYHLAGQEVKENRGPSEGAAEVSSEERVIVRRGDLRPLPGYRDRINNLIEGTPGTHILREGDWNAWLRESFRAPGTSAAGQPATLTPAVPDFTFTESGIAHMTSSLNLQLPGMPPNILFSVRGRLEAAQGKGLRFKAESGRLGRSPLPFLESLLAGRLVDLFLEAEGAPDLHEVWEKVSEVEVTQGQIRLVLGE
jgi:hypothetical protein